MTELQQTTHALLPLLLTLVGVGAALAWAQWWLLGREPGLSKTERFPRQLVLLGLGLASAVAVALSLPVSDSSRNQVIGLIGVLVSGVVAFSSTHLISNLMAGLMLRLTQAFRTGDFIRVQDHFGRVTERGLFDTEIQTDHRELVSLPNSYLIAHPVTVVRTSGTMVSSTLTLGYDVHHARIQPLLRQAAETAGLEDPFVHVLELGNFSVTYRVSGLLTEVTTLLTHRSRLNVAILDTLHGAGIEILSPGFMAQRRVPDGALVVPPQPPTPAPEEEAPAESVVFDKAEHAAQRSLARKNLKDDMAQVQAELAGSDGERKRALAEQLTALREQLADLSDTENDTGSDTGNDAGKGPDSPPEPAPQPGGKGAGVGPMAHPNGAPQGERANAPTPAAQG